MANDKPQHIDLESIMAEVVRISAMVRAQKIGMARLLAEAKGTTIEEEKENLSKIEQDFVTDIAEALAESTANRRG